MMVSEIMLFILVLWIGACLGCAMTMILMRPKQKRTPTPLAKKNIFWLRGANNMIDYHETARQIEVLGKGTQAQRREALIERLKRELQERFNYLPTRARMWRPAGVIVDGTVDGGLR